MTIKKALQDQRRVLLDLTYRNRLLNLPNRPSARTIVLHGESSGEIYELLVEQKRSLSFAAIAEDEQEEALPPEELVGSVEITLAQPDLGSEGTRRQGGRLLKTRLKSEHLQKRLLEVYYESRTMLEEQGVNVLYLALGQLRYFDPKKPEDVRHAPLVLLPVQLERKTARDRFVVRWSEEDLQENVSLREKLRVDFGLTLPEFPATEDFDVSEYFSQLGEVLTGQKGWSVVTDAIQLGFFSFAKLLMYLDLDPSKWPEGKEIDRQGLVSGLLGEGFEGSSADIGAEGPAGLDAVLPVARLQYVVDCDSSQAAAIEAVRRGENLVIQGPPGTGKSQTIANVIATAVADGKTVLFVAEKMAALEVVKRRLANVGLGPVCLELHSNKANKKTVLDELERTLRVSAPEKLDVQAANDKLTSLRDSLNRHACDLHREDIGAANLSPFEIIGNLAKRLPESSRPPYKLGRAAAWTRGEAEAHANLIGEACQHLTIVGPPAKNIWRGVNIAPVMRPAAEDLVDSVRELPERLGQVLESARALAGVLGIPAPSTLAGARAHCRMAAKLVNAPAFDRQTINSAVWSAGIDVLREAVDSGRKLAYIRAERSREVVDLAWDANWQAARLAVAAHGDNWLRWLNKDHRAAVAQLKGVAKGPLVKTKTQRLAILDDLIAAQKCASRLEEVEPQAKTAFGNVWKGGLTDWDLAESVLAWVVEQNAAKADAKLREVAATVEDRSLLKSRLEAARAALDGFAQMEMVLEEKFGYDEEEATDGGTLAQAELEDLRERFAAWQGGAEELVRWLAFNDVWVRIHSAGLGEALDSFANKPKLWPKAVGQFWVAYYLQMLEEAQSRRPDLARFDGRRHDELVAEFRRLDTQRLRVAQYEAAHAHYQAVPRSALGVGALGVLRSEIARKRGHLALRKLLKVCASPIQAAKPVFMMSPLSVAQYLEPGAISFDLLVIDEASQVEPVDAIGAIARCQQVVVVGDDKQLPPTSFFSRIVESEELDEDDEGAQAKDLESILSLCTAKGLPQRMLQWHYRSRHESLIAVSNKEFYEGNLFIVPSPDRARTNLGLKFHHLPDGRFDRGNSQKNQIEAQAIAQAVVDHARNRPHLTLGVGAMSVRQRQAITDEVELARRQHPELEHFFASHSHEPFFIKNLENIQGDERDVILISIGYGRSKATGQMYQSFGPLNSDGGHRRLNVLITRARMCCEVFSSIVADDIRIDGNSKPGLVALKSFLRYAQSGDLGIPMFTGRGVDSPFEEAVQAALTQRGYKVDNQVGVAGFFIDLAVVDPDMPGRYLLGIECDGAAYHSAPSARDRDRLRQDILEAHGWTIHRIWSTDWFQQMDREVSRLMAAIDRAKAGKKPMPKVREEAAPVRRLEAPVVEEQEVAPRMSVPYSQASFVPGNSKLAPHEVPLESMVWTVVKIVEHEGPIHQDEVVARVRDLWKLGRAGSRIQAAVAAALERAARKGQLESEDGCYVAPGRPILVRDRSAAESRTLKKPELLPPQEIRGALIQVVAEAHGVARDEAITAVSRMLGFSATSQQLRDVVANQISKSIEQGLLVDVGGMLEAASAMSDR